ncbi:MAG TPA: hypothetical protein VNO26_06955 [Candidatus Limnocylindria bacterium]|nr:hypothetical protein [Candidatus Limnocylindria bacterium]
MLSVHAHAYHAMEALPAGLTPASLNLPPLDQVVDVLLRDCAPQGTMRRRRAAAKIAAYARASPALDSAWKQLVIDGDLIAKFAAEIAASHERGAGLEVKLFEKAALLSNCPKDVENATFEGPAFKEGLNSWKVSFWTDATQDWVAPRLDPQHWDTCSPHFFSATFFTTHLPPRETSCSASPPEAPEDDVKTPGSTPYDVRLFEHVRYQNVEAATLLDINTRTGADCSSGPKVCGTSNAAYQACYSLVGAQVPCGHPPSGPALCSGASLYFCAGGQHEDMVDDRGDLSICTPASGTGSDVVVRKNVKFANPWTNASVWGIFWLSQKEMTEAAIDLAACCQLP